MTLGKKLMLGFMIPVVMLLGAGFWSYHRFHNLSQNVDAMLVENDRSIQAATQMTEALERLDSATLLLVVGEMNHARMIINEGDSLFRAALFVEERNITMIGEAELVDSLKKTYSSYFAHLNSLESTPTFESYSSKVLPAFMDAKRIVREIRSINSSEMYERAVFIGQQAYRATLPGMILMVGAVLFTLMFAWLIREHSIKPLRRLLKSTNQWLVTDQYGNPQVHTGDEIEELAKTLENLESTLKRRYKK